MNPAELLFNDKRLEGFWLTKWFGEQRLWKKLQIGRAAQRLLGSDLRTDVQARFPLEKIQDAIMLYKEKRTDGKVLLLPNPKT
jgi:NADPH2:quinone reductase